MVLQELLGAGDIELPCKDELHQVTDGEMSCIRDELDQPIIEQFRVGGISGLELFQGLEERYQRLTALGQQIAHPVPVEHTPSSSPHSQLARPATLLSRYIFIG